jgi:hypothetical protein
LNRAKLVFLSAFAVTAIGIRANSAAWAWGNQGHEIVAIIAADNLSPAAGGQVARMLGVASDTGSVEKAMAVASVRSDIEFREEDRATAPWHFIDSCLQDRRTGVSARCPAGDCVTAKIDEYIDRLKEGITLSGAPAVIWPSCSIWLAIFISPCTPPPMRTKAATVSRWNPILMREIFTPSGI